MVAVLTMLVLPVVMRKVQVWSLSWSISVTNAKRVLLLCWGSGCSWQRNLSTLKFEKKNSEFHTPVPSPPLHCIPSTINDRDFLERRGESPRVTLHDAWPSLVARQPCSQGLLHVPHTGSILEPVA